MAFGACAAYELHRRLRQAAVCTKDRVSRRREKSPRARQEHMSRPPAAPLSLAPNQVGCIEPRPLSVRDVWCDALRRIVRPGNLPRENPGGEVQAQTLPIAKHAPNCHRTVRIVRFRDLAIIGWEKSRS